MLSPEQVAAKQTWWDQIGKYTSIGPPEGGIPAGGLKMDTYGNFISNASGKLVPNIWQAEFGSPIVTGGPVPSTPQPATQPAPTPQPQATQPFQPQALNLDTSGVNPYLNDPLMALYGGAQSPYFQQPQQDFYGDPELFSAPSVSSAIR